MKIIRIVTSVKNRSICFEEDISKSPHSFPSANTILTHFFTINYEIIVAEYVVTYSVHNVVQNHPNEILLYRTVRTWNDVARLATRRLPRDHRLHHHLNL